MKELSSISWGKMKIINLSKRLNCAHCAFQRPKQISYGQIVKPKPFEIAKKAKNFLINAWPFFSNQSVFCAWESIERPFNTLRLIHFNGCTMNISVKIKLSTTAATMEKSNQKLKGNVNRIKRKEKTGQTRGIHASEKFLFMHTWTVSRIFCKSWERKSPRKKQHRLNKSANERSNSRKCARAFSFYSS